jgi:hypothetical protein
VRADADGHDGCYLLTAGFSAVEIRAFRSGSLSGYKSPAVEVEHTEAMSMAS